jgi:colanic acid/amylovoran biosynthesis glycosyltransferase
VHVVIAGDGPLRTQLEQNVQTRSLEQVCHFWGGLKPDEVYALLGISDIFLYTSTRGACMAMAVLEAMAAGCAVIASTEPLSNVVLLTNERGITVPTGDVEQTSRALLRLLSDANLCHQMGMLAREYIHKYHSPETFRRVLLRATYWSHLDELLSSEARITVMGRE